MNSEQPIVTDDLRMTELLSKKLALLVLDTGRFRMPFGLPRPEEFLPKRRAELNALAMALPCVTVVPGPECDPVSAIRASAASVAAHGAFFEALEGHLRLVGSRMTLDPELRKRCEEVLRAVPAEFDRAPLAQGV